MSISFPTSVIVVGAGVFGLSSALVIARRYPNTKVTVIDRHTPPVSDATSVDTSRILRPDYIDKVYERLAEKAQELVKNDPVLNPHYYENGFTFCVGDNPGPLNALWEAMLENVQKSQPKSRWEELKSHDDIYRSLHGEHAIPDAEFRGVRAWKKGYTSKRCAVVNAEAMVRIYYERCRATDNIHFELGSPVDQLLYTKDHDAVHGVVLENGRALYAERTILAAGLWTSRLVKLENRMHANAVPIVYIKLTPGEFEQYKNISCHTNLITGMNIFTPIGGLLKILRRTTSLRNTTILKDPEDPSKFYEVSYPRTKLDDPFQAVPLEIEQRIRAELREIFPQVADRPFYNTKFCWQEQTSNGDFLICPHPRFRNLQLATGGSLHAWKFLPLLGEFVADSMTGELDPGLAQKWSWESKSDIKPNHLCFMEDSPLREFQKVLGSKPEL